MEIEHRPVDALIPYVRNARTHSEDQVAQIAASIAEFGFVNPILIDGDDVIIAGHGRLMGAKLLGLDDVPVIVLDHLSEAQRRALVLADNRIAESAGWDETMLRSELAALRDDDFDLELIGFDEGELESILEGEGLGGVLAGPPDDAGDAAAPLGIAGASTLAERFGVPPFTVLDARKGWWQDRKRAWIDMGIRSELGRGGDTTPGQGKNGSLGWPGSGGDMMAKARKGSKSNAVPGGSPMPLDRAKNAKRKANATPGGSPLPATNYSKSKARGNGRGRPI